MGDLSGYWPRISTTTGNDYFNSCKPYEFSVTQFQSLLKISPLLDELELPDCPGRFNLGVLAIRDIDQQVYAANDLSIGVAQDHGVWRKPEARAIGPLGYAFDASGLRRPP